MPPVKLFRPSAQLSTYTCYMHRFHRSSVFSLGLQNYRKEKKSSRRPHRRRPRPKHHVLDHGIDRNEATQQVGRRKSPEMEPASSFVIVILLAVARGPETRLHRGARRLQTTRRREAGLEMGRVRRLGLGRFLQGHARTKQVA